MLKTLGIFLVLCLVCLYTDQQSEAFHSDYNLGNLVRWIGLFGILSIGVSFVIIGGGIDLSIGSVVGLSGTLLPYFLVNRFSFVGPVLEWALGSYSFVGWAVLLHVFPSWFLPLLVVVTVVAISVGIGLLHGLLVTKVGLQPFVVTLCGLLCYRGLSRYITDDVIQGYQGQFDSMREWATGKPFAMTDVMIWFGGALAALFLIRLALSLRREVRGVSNPIALLVATLSAVGLAAAGWWVEDAASKPEYAEWGRVQALSTLDAPTPFLIMMSMAVVASVFLTKTVWGRSLYALGRNEQAARYSGIRTDRYVILSYVLCSLLAGIGGMLFSLDLNAVEPDRQGNFFELYAIAAAVLGGCSLRGGEGAIVGVLIGTAIMRVLNNSILLLDIPSQLEFAIIGAVILVGVIADEVLKRLGSQLRAKWSARKGRTASGDPP